MLSIMILELCTSIKHRFNKRNGRDLTQSYNKSPYTHRKIQKAAQQQQQNATKTLITQRLRTDLGRST